MKVRNSSILKFFLFTLFTGVLSLTPNASVARLLPRPKVIQWYECPSQTLRILLNQDNESKKSDLVGALQALSEYPELRVRPVNSVGSEVAFEVNGPICESQQGCAAPNGWTELQWRLKAFKGVAVSCATEDSKQEEDGGISGDN